MILLEKPEFAESGEEIFQECIDGYTRSPDKLKKLEACKPMVAQDTERYERLVREGAKFPRPILPDGIEPKDLHCVYEEKFSKDGSTARTKYYDVIMEQVEDKNCPICDGNGSVDMDHFLPKSVYPTLCTFPSNLIPICNTCNKKKKEKCRINGQGEPVHLYLDRIPTEVVDGKERHKVYLYVRLGNNFEAEYYVQCPPEWNQTLRRRLEDQMDVYDLSKRFPKEAARHMVMLEVMWRKRVESQRKREKKRHPEAMIDMEELWHDAIEDTLDAEMEIDPNSWRSALCRALYDDVNRLVAWLQRRMDEEEQNNT